MPAPVPAILDFFLRIIYFFLVTFVAPAIETNRANKSPETQAGCCRRKL
jgi:hypothetical protein